MLPLALAIFSSLSANVAQADDRDSDKVTDLKAVNVKATTDAPGRTGTKLDAPLIEVPQSISVITSDDIVIRAAHSLSDALTYSAGVSSNATGTDQRYDWPYIRGFSAGSQGIYVDGLRFQPGQFAGRVEPYLAQEIAILKGPASVLYGQNSPGGLINVTSKMPQAESLHEVGVSVGNNGYRQAQGDFAGALNESGTWQYRLTGTTHDNDTQMDHSYDKRVAIAPAITWAPDADTHLTLLANYQRDLTNAMYPFLPVQGTVYPNPNGRISTSLFVGDPDFDSYRRSQYGLGYQFSHRIDDTWTVRLSGRAERIEVDWRQLYATGSISPDLRSFNRFAMHDLSWSNAYTFDNQAVADFETGEFKHKVLLGLDASYNVGFDTSYGALATPIDAFAPVYNQPVPALGAPGSEVHQVLKQTGLYAQDQITWGKWVGLFSARHDWVSSSTHDQVSSTESHQDDGKNTFRAGIVYVASNGLSPYVSWATSFEPNTGTNFQGTPFAPSVGKQIEGGLKYQPRDMDAFVTVSVFDIHQTNVLTTDVAHPQFSIATGEMRSRGAELEGVANPLPGLQLRAAYTYDQVETTRSTDPTAIGKPPVTVPMHMASLWADYTLQGGAARGLGFGAGVRRLGESYGGTYAPNGVTTDFNVPGFTLVDAVVHYDIDGVRLALNANNLLDKRYVSTCYGDLGCTFGNRRTVMASATYRW
nr:TonB-dependent siderophore receptor [Luteibacter sp. Sphag1AF]